MIDKIFKIFIKNHNDTKNPIVRQRYGIFSSVMGLILNFLLFVLKYFIGTVSMSISVQADSFNNLSDMGSSAITLFGFKISNKEADNEHPFGHGRIEYISGLIVSFIIFTVGIEFIKTSVNKIFNPETVIFTVPMIIVLILTIPIKFIIAFINLKIGKKIDSAPILAAGTDSFNDMLVTSATIISALLSLFISFPIDGYIGLVVALYIIYSAFSIAMETVNSLLGEKPDNEVVKEIEKRILSYDNIIGIHDLIVHNYGAEKYIASVHAEVSADSDILKIHDIIDLAEREIASAMGIMITIHMDPIETNNEEVTKMREMMYNILTDIHPKLNLHDFRVVSGDTHTNLIFDVVIKKDIDISEKIIKDKINEQLEKLPHKYYAVIVFDHEYV